MSRFYNLLGCSGTGCRSKVSISILDPQLASHAGTIGHHRAICPHQKLTCYGRQLPNGAFGLLRMHMQRTNKSNNKRITNSAIH